LVAVTTDTLLGMATPVTVVAPDPPVPPVLPLPPLPEVLPVVPPVEPRLDAVLLPPPHPASATVSPASSAPTRHEVLCRI
jgi:hypothetical protein